jgi:hypothetical protein
LYLQFGIVDTSFGEKFLERTICLGGVRVVRASNVLLANKYIGNSLLTGFNLKRLLNRISVGWKRKKRWW